MKLRALLVFTLAATMHGQQPASSSAAAETTEPLRLESILDRLEANIIEYETHIPNLFCAEHVISDLQRQNTMQGRQHTESDSVFRLRREPVADSTPNLFDLNETREVKLVDGRTAPPDQAQLAGPTLLSGVFSSGLNIVSNRGKQCFTYKMKPRKDHDGSPIVIQFENRPQAQYGRNCPQFEATTGRATIDPVSLHITKMEKRSPHHEIYAGTVGLWRWTVDYTPVQLNGQTFFLPRTITSIAEYSPLISASPGRGRPSAITPAGPSSGALNWTFTAAYKDFHLLTATSRVLPSTPAK